MIDPKIVDLLREIDKSEPKSIVVTWTGKNGVTTSRCEGFEGDRLIVSLSYQRHWIEGQLAKSFRDTRVSGMPPVIHGPTSAGAAATPPGKTITTVPQAVKREIRKAAKKGKRS